jgi:transcriptional regulator with XRE-family HTH domain
MPAQPSTALLRRSIALDLTRFREMRGITTQTEAAKLMGISAARISQVEGRHRLPSEDFADLLLDFYEVRGTDREDFLARLAAARAPAPAPVTTRQDPQEFDLYSGLEQGATKLESWNALVLHGLVQTSEYAEALLRGHDDGSSEIELQRRLRARIKRQEILSDSPATRLELVGGPEVMSAQLAHLMALAKRPNITIQVLPRTAVPHSALHGAFMIMRFDLPNDPGLVYVENRISGAFFEDAQHIAEYSRVLSGLQAMALSPAESVRVMSSVRKGFT